MSRNMNQKLDREIKMPRKMNFEIDREIKMHEKNFFFLTVKTVKNPDLILTVKNTIIE